jgi:hypothetical protein
MNQFGRHEILQNAYFFPKFHIKKAGFKACFLSVVVLI